LIFIIRKLIDSDKHRPNQWDLISNSDDEYKLFAKSHAICIITS